MRRRSLKRSEILCGVLVASVFFMAFQFMVLRQGTTIVANRVNSKVTVESSSAVKGGAESQEGPDSSSAPQRISKAYSGGPDIRMSKLYDDELDLKASGAPRWPQGWDIAYNETEVLMPANKLKVFLMPHSHNDPGWKFKFEEYYFLQTKHILDNAVAKLAVDRRRKFVWAEVCFLAMWWSEQPPEVREAFRKLVLDGQMEIVTGGWVMPDEANSHLYSLVEQLVLGHEWLRNHLGDFVEPRYGWSIDPFGHSPAIAYLLKRSGFEAAVIQRTHYAVKMRLARSQDLEFLWRQHWATDAGTDLLTHMMPFFSYSIPYSCGPDSDVCCQFDFMRQADSKWHRCPSKALPAIAITEENVAERSRTLLDQFRKKAQLFRTNSVLVPLGDDFRYSLAEEWDAQFLNYERIIEYVNGHPELNAELSFGTLRDYFASIRSDLLGDQGSGDGGDDGGGRGAGTPPRGFKTLTGDFFTYADRADHYWSGYYTTRPYHKSMDRVLVGYLRAAEVLFSLSWAEEAKEGSASAGSLPAASLMNALVGARERLALFQHHDGITGTATDRVMEDYRTKMLEGIKSCQKVISQSARYLLQLGSSSGVDDDPHWFHLDDALWPLQDSLIPQPTVIKIKNGSQPSLVVLFNSVAKLRSETVSLTVSRPDVAVFRLGAGGKRARLTISQVSPVFDQDGHVRGDAFKVSFVVKVKAFSLTTFSIEAAVNPDESSSEDTAVAAAEVSVLNSGPWRQNPVFRFDEFEALDAPDHRSPPSHFSLQNTHVRLHFGPQGMLRAVTTLKDNVTTKVELQFVRYQGVRSGAYLFLPDGPAEPVRMKTPPLMRVTRGLAESRVEVHFDWMVHSVTLFNSPGPDGHGILVQNTVDVRKMNNQELAMRFVTSLDSRDEFFTDSNLFQMVRRRRRWPELPLQANYYPMPSMAYIEDATSGGRFSILSRQPLGCSSLGPGQLEVMLDRRLMQDDQLGLGAGVTDNRVTRETFVLLLERQAVGATSRKADDGETYPSLTALSLRDFLLNPLVRMVWEVPQNPVHIAHVSPYEPVEDERLGSYCDVDVLNLRTVARPSPAGTSYEPSDQVALVLHRQGHEDSHSNGVDDIDCGSGKGDAVVIGDLFPRLFGEEVTPASLTQTVHKEAAVIKKSSGMVFLNPMEIQTFVLKR